MTERDLEAMSFLYPHSDRETVNSILRNNIQLSDLEYYRNILSLLEVDKAAPSATCRAAVPRT